MKYNELLRILKKDGWYELRQSGSHIVMAHPEKENTVIVPNHDSHEVKKGLLKSIIKQTGIKRKKR